MPGLSAIVVSYNRREALLHTLRRLLETPGVDEIIVVDNGSSDGCAQAASDLLAGRHRVLALNENTGVAAFNSGASIASGEFLLILDDDSWPEPTALHLALAAARADRMLGAVALSPTHPRTGVREWPHVINPTDALPMMGCGNLIRADAWRRAGGYESGYFLYRNDADLALTLLGLGYRVLYDPEWTVWHDSPAAAAKSLRWLRLATRNWVWMARRHGVGFWKWLGVALGAVRAFMHAGEDTDRVQAVAEGLRAGLTQRPPPGASAPGGRWWRKLVLLQLTRGG
ncbi:MAG: glycosyltransferase family 2 protein [Phycisphaerales bacterium]